jgi:hypothetical protein
MMLFSHQQRVDDQTLRGYLFGLLPRDQTERLDELSVVDDEFAARLDTVESDLVDAYVRGELSGDTLAKFQSVYLSSPRRRQKVAFAESLYSLGGKHLSPAATNRLEPAKGALRLWLGLFALPRLALAGGLAMLLAITALLVDNLHLRDGMRQATVERAALQQRERDLQTRLDNEHASDAQTASELEQVRKSLAQLDNSTAAKHVASQLTSLPVSVVAFVLAPQVRGGTQMPVLSLPQGTTRVDFHLDLETNDFPHYRVTLKSLQDDKVLWHSGQLTAVTKGQSSALSTSVPANLLQPQGYELDLTGTPSGGEGELVSSYVFRVVTK